MSLETMEQRTERTERTAGMRIQAQELIDQAYKCWYNAGYAKAENDYHAQTEKDRQSSYELGLNEAWDAARTLLKVSIKESNEILSCDGDETFEDMTLAESFCNISASRAIKKIRAYEKKKQEEDSEIRVGDEVVNNNGDKGIVLCYYHETDSCGNWKEEWLVVYMSNYDVPQTVTKKRFKKTGKHYDVMSILKKMKEVE